MAKASVASSTSAPAESSATTMISRNHDPMTLALRTEGAVDIDQLIELNRTTSPTEATPSSLGTRTATVFSSREQSSGTKQTSAGTSYPVDRYKGKAVATYASSLSATHGSVSEAEAEQDVIRDTALFGVGDWAVDGPVASPPLKGAARARKRPRINKRHKKPVVIIQRECPANAPSSEDEGPATKQVHRHSGNETKYLRHRRSKPEYDELVLAEEGRAVQSTTEVCLTRKRLSRARRYLLVSVVSIILLTFALASFAAHYTGKQRLACTEGIIFACTVLVSWLTVLAMLIARRALQEALLAGLLEFIVGFALVVKIHDFM